jgi:hypothetical protein
LYCALGAAVLTGLSGLLYVWDGVKQLGSHPNSSATERKPPMNADGRR